MVSLCACRTVPPELSKQHGQLPGKLKGILGMPGLTSQMEAIHSKVQSLLSTHQQANEQGSIDQAQLDEWRDAVTKWPISNLQHPLSFNRPASWAPPGLVAKSRPSTTPEQSPKTEERAAAPITPPNPSSQPVAPGVYVFANSAVRLLLQILYRLSVQLCQCLVVYVC